MPKPKIRVLVVLLLCLLALGGCSADEPGTPTGAEISASCGELADSLCHKQIDCQGSAETFDACVRRETNSCIDDTQKQEERCWRAAVDEADECTQRVEERTCGNWCSTTSDGFTLCGVNCFYICAAPPADPATP